MSLCAYFSYWSDDHQHSGTRHNRPDLPPPLRSDSFLDRNQPPIRVVYRSPAYADNSYPHWLADASVCYYNDNVSIVSGGQSNSSALASTDCLLSAGGYSPIRIVKRRTRYNYNHYQYLVLTLPLVRTRQLGISNQW